MSDIAPISNTFASNNLSAGSGVQADAGEEFNSFIQLLTAQVRNQDPLAPLDSTQFVEQLATFSTLEQQVQSNDALSSIANMIFDLGTLLANEWLGEQITVESSYVPYTGSSIEYEVDRPENVDRAQLSVRDSSGEIVWNETLDLSDERFVWNGQLTDGPATNDSLYQLSIDFFRGNEFAGSTAPRLVTTVTNVATENGQLRVGTDLNLSAGAEDIRMVNNS